MLSAGKLRELMYYNKNTGDFIWLVGNKKGFVVGQKHRTYIRCSIKGKKYYMHRLAFLYMTGEFPKNNVDHIDLDGFNNRWDNLRDATKSQNAVNTNLNSSNTSGFRGVSKFGNKWRATITMNKQFKHLGYFDTPEEASEKYVEVAEQYFGDFYNKEKSC